MKITIKKSGLLAICIVLCILILDDFWGFGSPIKINITYLFFGSIIVSYILCILCFSKTFMKVLHNDKYLNVYLLLTIMSFVFLFGYSLIQYPAQNFKETMNTASPYLALLLVYPIYIYISVKDDDKALYNILEVFSLIIYFLILIQFITYKKGIMIFPEESIRMRNGSIRIGLHFYGNFMILYNFYQIYYRKNKSILRILLFLIGIFELIFIQQTRAYTLVILVNILAMILLEKNTKNKLLKKIIIVALVAGIILQTDIVANFIQSLSTTGEEAGSTIGRQYSITYYLSMFKTHFPFGMGFPNNDKYGYILHHQVKNFTTYTDDVGFIGQLGIWGLLLIPIFIVPIIRMIKIIIRLKKQGYYDSFVWCTTMLLYIIITSGTLMILDSYRIMLMPIIVALTEFENIKLIK